MSDADDPRNHPSYQPPPPPPPPFEQQPWAGAPAPQRPPQVTAAAVVLFVLAAINLLFGIAALAGVTGLPTGDFGTGLAIFSFVVAALQAVAGSPSY